MLEQETANIARSIRSILLDELPISPGLVDIIDAIVVAEDRRFWTHKGIDLIGIGRAIIHFVRYRKISGASTIEQQLVRTIRRRYELTISRKASEIVLALNISRLFSKNEIVSAYLQIAYFGWKATGIRQLAERFEIDVDIPDMEKAVFVASLLKLPMPRVPSEAYLERLKRRMNYVQSALK